MGQKWTRPKSSHGFKFLELPLVVKRQVLKCSELRDLFIFSQLSKKSYGLVQDAVIKLKCVMTLQKEQVLLPIRYNTRDALIFIFGKHGYYKLYGSILTGKAVFNGEKFDYHFDSSYPGFLYTREQDATDAIDTVFRYFSELFHFSSFTTIFLNPDFLDFFESVELFEEYMFRIGNPKTEQLRIQGTPLTGPVLIRFIDSVRCSDRLKIDAPFRGRLSYHKINEMNIIQLWNGQVEESDFLSFKAKHVHLKNIRFSEKVLVEFVKKWLRKESEIESLILKLHESMAWKAEDNGFAGLGTTTWDPRKRGKYYRWKKPGVFNVEDGYQLIDEWDCSEGLDIVRSDGLMATISLTEDTFTFFVWNQRFH